jgi:hypothetical protein
MLWTIFVILVVMWALGLVTSYTMGRFRPSPLGYCPDNSSGQSGSGTKSLVKVVAATSLGPICDEFHRR